MKKTILPKNSYKAAPLVLKKFKSCQKLPLQVIDLNDITENSQTLKLKIEALTKNLNEQVKQRQFQFKQLYKMIVDLQSSRKSKCKHVIPIIQRKDILQNRNDPVQFPVLANITGTKKNQKLLTKQSTIFNVSLINQLNQSQDVKKQKRKLKSGQIKSHKNIIFNQKADSYVHNQYQNQEDQYTQQTKQYAKGCFDSTSDKFFNNSSVKDFFMQTQQEFISPNKSTISIKNDLSHQIDQISTKMLFYEQRIKCLEVSQSLMSQDIHENKKCGKRSFNQVNEVIKHNIQKTQQFIKNSIKCSIKQTQEELLHKLQSFKKQYSSLNEGMKNHLETSISQILFKAENKINDLQKLVEQNHKQMYQQQLLTQRQINCEKLYEFQSRLDNTQQVVSQLMKLSLTLTQKIDSDRKGIYQKQNKNAYKDDKQKCKDNKQKCKYNKKKYQAGLSASYWSLKQELNKIDEQQFQNSVQNLIDHISNPIQQIEDSISQKQQNQGHLSIHQQNDQCILNGQQNMC